MATIRKRGDNYQIRASAGYGLDGKQIIKSTTFTPEPGLTEKQEKRALDEFVLDFERLVKSGQYLDSSVKFATFAEQWFTDYAEPQLAPKTVYRYKELMPRINSFIGNIRLDKIQPQHIISMNNGLTEPGLNKKTGGALSPQTVLYHYRLVSSILSTAVEWQVIFANPCARVKAPKAPLAEAEVLDEEQAKYALELMDNEPLKFKVAYILAIFSGFRRGEITGLKWPDIDYKNCVITVNRTTQYLPGRGIFVKDAKNKKSLRSIKLPLEVFTLLKEYQIWQLEERFRIGSAWHDNGYLFTTWDGSPMHPDTLTNEFKAFAVKNNLPEGIHLHSLRHTSGTLQIAAGVNVRTVSARLGHAQTSTTMNIYAHAIQSADAAASEVLADILNPTKKDIKKLG